MSRASDTPTDENPSEDKPIRLELRNMKIGRSSQTGEFLRAYPFTLRKVASTVYEQMPRQGERLLSERKQPNYDGMEAALAEIRATLLHVSSSLDDVKADVREQRSDIKGVRADMNTEFKAVRSEIGAVSTGVGTLSGDLGTLRERVSHLPGKGYIVTAALGILTVLGAFILFQTQIRTLVGL